MPSIIIISDNEYYDACDWKKALTVCDWEKLRKNA